MTPLAASISDATLWSVTFDDTRSVDYARNSFIIQATEVQFAKGWYLQNSLRTSYDHYLNRDALTQMETYYEPFFAVG
jgi:hypothetical protein